MSFHSKNFWLPRDSACLTDGFFNPESSSKVEQKRTHQCDVPVREFFSNKRLAVESIVTEPISENVGICLWNNPSGCHSVSGFSDHLYVPESIGACETISSKDSGHLNAQVPSNLDQFGNVSASNLAMSHEIEQPFFGMGKASVDQAGNFGNGFSESMMQPLNIGENDIFSRCIPQPIHERGNVNVMSPEEVHIMSMGQTLAKANDDPVLIGHFGREAHPVLSAEGLPYSKWDQQYGKKTSGFMPTATQNMFTISHHYDKAAEISTGGNNAPDAHATNNKDDSSAVSKGMASGKQNSNILPMGANYYEGGASMMIAFGGDSEDVSDVLLSSPDCPGGQSLVIPANARAQNDFMERNFDQLVNAASTISKPDGALKIKEQKKKSSTNNFPSNVKSMLSTGIFDGVPVKYVSWSREKSLQAVIKGTGYVCGCSDCNHSKALSAYEFERHAGGKTKHPNNHIFFENGRSVYAAVLELKSTPQEMLFEAIEKVTGSPINQKNFRIWKVSYQAASRELERIYGKEEAVK